MSFESIQIYNNVTHTDILIQDDSTKIKYIATVVTRKATC